MPGLFVVYEKVGPGVGRITNSMNVLDEAAYAAQLDAQGQRYYFVPLDGFTGYFELDENDAVVAINTRHPFVGAFAPASVPVLQVATLADVPATTVQVTGPSTRAEIPHAGGDLKLRLGLPGEYVVSFEAFPFQRFETTLVVTPTLADPATPKAAA